MLTRLRHIVLRLESKNAPTTSSADDSLSTRRHNARVRRLALPTMGGVLALYVAIHSPLRDIIAALFGKRPQPCYFVCGDLLMSNSTIESVLALVLIAVALLAAWIVADGFDGVPYERPLVFSLSTVAFIIAPAAVVAGFGTWTGTALLRPPVGLLLSILPATLVVVGGVKRGWRPHRPRFTCIPVSGLVLFVGAIAVGLFLVSTVLSLVRPPDGGDAISYHAPLAVFLWRDGNLSAFLDRAPIAWALANPGSAELWYGLLGIVAGEGLADLGQLPFAILGAVAVGVFARRLGLSRGAAYLGGPAFLLAPMVVMQSTTQANDIAGSALLMATIALACAPLTSWTISRFAWLGVGMGLIATTKLALLPYVCGLIGFAVGLALWAVRRNLTTRAVALRLALMALMFLLIVGPWWLRNIGRYGNPVYPAGIPLIGRGVFVSDFGKIDGEFVPTPLAWPLYPFVEPHDDRSGFGMLFAVAAVPGLVMAVRRRGRRQPFLVFGIMAAFMLPAWWKLTMHEPRFLLALAGLGCAFVPGALLVVPRRRRHLAAVLLGVAAIFSALVTFDQALLPLARQPTDRAEFYDRVWGVDPITLSLPEQEGFLHHTGFGPPKSDYAAYYPLLGPARTRIVIPADSEMTTDAVVAKMRSANIRYAYISSLPEARTKVEAIYDPAQFELVHVSEIERGESSGARRYLYRAVRETDNVNGIRRYLYRLKGL
jgi:hypothetical protein